MDNIRDTLQNATKNAYKATKGFVKSAKMSIDLSGEESRLKALYIEIGKKVHEIYTYGGSLGKFFDEKYAEILECEAKIQILRKEVDRVRGNKTCAKCGKTTTFASEYCPKCGTDLHLLRAEVRPPAHNDEQYANSNDTIETKEQSATVKKCLVCGNENSAENKYCYGCGKFL